jgi:hypothetical protein
MHQGHMSEAGAAAVSRNRVQSRLEDVCRAAVVALAAQGAAASLFATAGANLVLATDAIAAVLEREQQKLGEGPTLMAFESREPVLVRDLRGEDARGRWPSLAGAVADVQVGRFLALPMSVGGIRLGVLSLYSTAGGPLPHRMFPAALLAADTAALAMLDAESEPPDALPLSELGPVLDYRVHQATGMVMGQTGLDAHDAFTRLRAYAFSEDVALRRLATDVISRRIRFDQEET